MFSERQVTSHKMICNGHRSALKEVVLGLHWDPLQNAAYTQPADLDAICVLFDAHEQMLEVIHPGHLRNSDGSITHTGDSRTGASDWDDERIFVFLDALPARVVKLAFLVLSVAGKPFHRVPGARCHLSDRITEAPHVEIELTTLSDQTAHTVAVLRRGSVGWHISTDDALEEGELLEELKTLVRTTK